MNAAILPITRVPRQRAKSISERILEEKEVAKLFFTDAKQFAQSKAAFFAANGSRVRLHGIAVENRNLDGLDLSHCDFSGAGFINTSFAGANLTGTLFRNTHFDWCGFDSANLALTSFSRAVAVGFSAKGANFKESNLFLLDARGAVLDGACFDGADFSGAKLPNASFIGAFGEKTFFTAAVFDSANFSGSKFKGAYFRRTELKSALFEGAILSHSIFDEAKLGGTNFGASDLSFADFKRALLLKTRFRNANLTNADIREIDVNEGDFLGANLRGAFLTKVEGIEDKKEHEKIKNDALIRAKAREEGVEIEKLDFPDIVNFPSNTSV